MFQHTAARRRLALQPQCFDGHHRFNTQPPEGGWIRNIVIICGLACFNTQPPEGGWLRRWDKSFPTPMFQHTAARRRLGIISKIFGFELLFQHTAARRRLGFFYLMGFSIRVFQHTAARRRLAQSEIKNYKAILFQHTAARRRLVDQAVDDDDDEGVSTHSRPKAAGSLYRLKLKSILFQHTAARRRLAVSAM